MILLPGQYAPNQKPHTYGLTATERAEILNWACFDTLRTFRPLLYGLGDRYLMSPEFEPTDLPQVYLRMKKILESVPAADPVQIPVSVREELHKSLDNCWFSQRLSDNFYSMGGYMGGCFSRARYIFVSHWLLKYATFPPEYAVDWMTQEIVDLGKLGMDKRFALQEVPFKGRTPA